MLPVPHFGWIIWRMAVAEPSCPFRERGAIGRIGAFRRFSDAVTPRQLLLPGATTRSCAPTRERLRGGVRRPPRRGSGTLPPARRSRRSSDRTSRDARRAGPPGRAARRPVMRRPARCPRLRVAQASGDGRCSGRRPSSRRRRRRPARTRDRRWRGTTRGAGRRRPGARRRAPIPMRGVRRTTIRVPRRDERDRDRTARSGG